MNELAIIFNRMGIDSIEVLEAAGTKWNFLPFRPGLVGGHCIGVDPFYLTYKAEQMGYHPEVILAGRRINDGMGKYIAEHTVKMLIAADKSIRNARVAVMGLTFKEDIPDIRNTKVVDIIAELQGYGVNVLLHDPLADAEEVSSLNLQLTLSSSQGGCVIVRDNLQAHGCKGHCRRQQSSSRQRISPKRRPTVSIVIGPLAKIGD
jgi:nucleotide sugar dehydrogenase